MSKLINLTGERFGRLFVIKRVNNDKWGKLYWLCQCNCGKTKIIRGNDIKNGATKSCGCLRREELIKRLTKHGHSQNDKTYQSWDAMIQRCTNPNNIGYKYYGGRKITVCKRWLKFINFFQDMGKRPKGKTIDRINKDGNYCLKNCKWTTVKEQARNRRDNWLITFDGKKLCPVEWAEKTGINAQTIRSRLKRNWSPQKTLTTPVQKRRK